MFTSKPLRPFSFTTRPAAVSATQFLAVVALAFSLGLGNVLWGFGALPAGATEFAVDDPIYKGQISIYKEVALAPKSARVNLKLRDTPVRDVLNMLAKQGGFNIIMDESVEGDITVDVNNITINKALQYIFTMQNLSYSQDGNTVLVATAEAAAERALNAKSFKAIPVKYKDAAYIATTLNNTIFRSVKPGTTPNAIATNDIETNSLLIMGAEYDIQLVNEALKQLDVPPITKTIKVMHNDPVYVMTGITMQMFPGGAQGGGGGGAQGGGGGAQGGGGGGAQGGGGGGAQGGGGGGAQGGGGGGAQGGGGGGAQGGGGGGAQGGGGGNAFSRAGFSILANLVTGNLVMQGTPEQLEMAEKIAKEIDVRRPQMMIEVALIELSKSSTKVFDVTPTGSFGLGEFRLGLLGKNYNVAAGNGYGGTGGGLRVPSIDVSFAETLSKGKVLANPTIVALDGTSSSINITDSIVYFQTQTNVAAGVSTTTVTPQTQQVGIQLSLTPQMTNDGMVTLTLNPTVTQLLGIISGPGGTTSPQVASRTLSIAQVRVRDGETLVLGGLVRDVRTENLRKVPGLADLPIVGAFFRTTGATGNVNSRTELVMMVTPHILKDTETSYFAHQNTPSVPTPKVNAGENGLITPSPMPHFTPEQLPALSKNAFVETGRFQLPNGSKARSSAANVKPMSKMLPYAMPTKSSTASRGPAPALRGAAAGLEAPLANPFVAPASTSASTSASSAASPALPPTP